MNEQLKRFKDLLNEEANSDYAVKVAAWLKEYNDWIEATTPSDEPQTMDDPGNTPPPPPPR